MDDLASPAFRMGARTKTARRICRRAVRRRLSVGRSGRPESAERPAVGGFAQLLEGAFADLADALPSHAHQRPDLLESHGLGALFQPIVEVEDLPLPGGQVLLEYAIDELAHQLVVRHLFDLGAVNAGEALTEGGGFAVRPVDWGVEADLRGRHLLGRTDVLGGVLEEPAHFVFGGVTLEDLGENGLGAG